MPLLKRLHIESDRAVPVDRALVYFDEQQAEAEEEQEEAQEADNKGHKKTKNHKAKKQFDADGDDDESAAPILHELKESRDSIHAVREATERVARDARRALVRLLLVSLSCCSLNHILVQIGLRERLAVARRLANPRIVALWDALESVRKVRFFSLF